MGLEQNPKFYREIKKSFESSNLDYGKNTDLERFIKKMEDEWEDYRPTPEAFLGLGTYPSNKIERDQATVNKREQTMSEKPPESIAAEYLTLEGAYNHYWFDRQNTETKIQFTPAADFDDYENGIDLILAIKDQPKNQWRYLGIDVTTANNEADLEKKLNHTAIATKHKQLAHVDYYLPQTKNKGEPIGRVDLARVVLGFDRLQVRQLAKDFLTSKGANLDQHPIQLELIQETIDQLTIAMEKTVNYWVTGRTRSAVPKEFHTPQEAIDFADHYAQRENADPKVVEILETHSQILKYLINLQKEKSSLGEISLKRARGQQFRHLAPRKSSELLAH